MSYDCENLGFDGVLKACELGHINCLKKLYPIYQRDRIVCIHGYNCKCYWYFQKAFDHCENMVNKKDIIIFLIENNFVVPGSIIEQSLEQFDLKFIKYLLTKFVVPQEFYFKSKHTNNYFKNFLYLYQKKYIDNIFYIHYYPFKFKFTQTILKYYTKKEIMKKLKENIIQFIF